MITRENIRLGAKIDNYGQRSAGLTAIADAQSAEAAGFDSLWMSDHVLMPESTECKYPFSDTGDMVWDPTGPWFDSLIWSMALLTATERVEVGTAVLIPGLRNPLDLAKQIASLDRLSGGRFVMGVGAGWLTEEFTALGISPSGRGTRLDEWLDICRKSWTGAVEPFEGKHFSLDQKVYMVPTPAREVPVLIGGMSDLALKRVARHKAGWLPLLKPSEDPIEVIGKGIARIRQFAEENGDPYVEGPRVMFNAAGAEELSGQLDTLIEAGVTEVMVDVDFDDPEGAQRAVAILRGDLP